MNRPTVTIPPGPQQRAGRRHRRPLWLLLLLLAAASAGAEEALQSHAEIRSTAESLLAEQLETPPGARSEIHADRLAPRLRLAACDEPLEAFLPPSGRTVGNTTVGVRCNGEHPWTLYVPVRVEINAPVLVATRPLARGDHVGPDDIAPAERDLAGLRSGYFTDPRQVVGQVLKRPVPAQQALSPRMLQVSYLVEKGQRVILRVAGGHIQVHMAGTALADGALGDLIKVRNLSSERVVEGRVVDQGTVQVNF